MNCLLSSCLGFAFFKSPKTSIVMASFGPTDEFFHWVVPEGVPFGSLDKLQFRPMNLNEKDATNMLCTISTRAIGLNFADIFCILGLYSAANQVRGNAAFCPGLEYSGVIVDDPTGTFSPGQRVLGFTRFGGYSDFVQVPPYFLYPMPDHWSFVQGAGFLVQALTAWHGLV
jgi:NADPH:quinone reductase-like Zn-dependent oxidoreductase